MSLYYHGMNALLEAHVDWVGDTIKALLLDDRYIFNPQHAILSDVSPYEIVATAYARKTLAGKTETYPDSKTVVLDASDLSWAGLGGAVNDMIRWVVVYALQSPESSSTLLCCKSVSPVLTSGAAFAPPWDSAGIIRLTG